MDTKDYLICENEYNSYNKTRGKITQALKEFEKKFRDKNFAQSKKGSAILAVTSFYAGQLLKLQQAIEEDTDELADKILKELMQIAFCTEEGKEYLNNLKNDSNQQVDPTVKTPID
jgi:uncharacterized membrane protein